jgi:hypothetical protein
MTTTATRYIFSGHAIGAAAQFHRLDETHNLNHIVPTLGASVLAGTGGLSRSEVSNYCFNVDQPRRRSLLAVRKVETTAAGRDHGDRFETEVEARIESLQVVEKLHVEHISMHILSTFKSGGTDAAVSTRGNKIEGMSLGIVKAHIEFDDEPLGFCANKEQLAGFYRNKDAEYRRQSAWRFRTAPDATEIAPHGSHYKVSLVRKIVLEGSEAAKQDITVDGYTIIWKGFGKIILGEVYVKGNDRQLTMVRLAMGSDAGGSGSVGSGQSNGATSGV